MQRRPVGIVDNEEHHRSDQNRRTTTLTGEAKRVLFYTYVAVGVCQASFFVYNSLLPYLCKQYGMNPVVFGYMQSSAALLQLILSPLIGRCGDKFGARAVLILSLVSITAGHVVLGLANGMAVLILSRTATIPQDVRLGAQILTSDLYSGRERGIALGKIVLPMSIGMFIGPTIAGQLAQYIGSQQSLLLTWIAPAVALGLVLGNIPRNTKNLCKQKPEPPSPSNNTENTQAPHIWRLLQRNSVRFLLAAKLLTSVPFMTLAQNLTVIGMVFRLSPAVNGLFLSYNGLLGMVISVFLLGWLSRRYTEDKLLKAGSVIMIFTYAMLTQVHSVWMLGLLLIPWNVGHAILDNQILATLITQAPGVNTGVVVGLNAAMFQFSKILGPLVGGHLIHTAGFQAIGYFGLSVSVCLATVVYTGMRSMAQPVMV